MEQRETYFIAVEQNERRATGFGENFFKRVQHFFIGARRSRDRQSSRVRLELAFLFLSSFCWRLVGFLGSLRFFVEGVQPAWLSNRPQEVADSCRSTDTAGRLVF